MGDQNQTVQKEESEKKMKIRPLKLKDAFKLSEILDKMDVDLDLNDIFDRIKKLREAKKAKAEGKEPTKDEKPTTEDEPKLTERIGAQLALSVIKKIHRADRQFYEFIGGLTGDTADEVSDYGLTEIGDLFTAIIEDPEFAAFFPSAGEKTQQN